MSSKLFRTTARSAFAEAEAAMQRGLTLDAVVASCLIVPSATEAGVYDFYGDVLYYDSAGYLFYCVRQVPVSAEAIVVECWCQQTCGGGHAPPELMYTVSCPTLVDVAHVLLRDQGQPYGCQAWGKDSGFAAIAPTVHAALRARDHSLLRRASRSAVTLLFENLQDMVKHRKDPVQSSAHWFCDALESAGLALADLDDLETYFASKQGDVSAMMRDGEALWPPCLLTAANHWAPVSVEPL
jgi:hypothetical protein